MASPSGRFYIAATPEDAEAILADSAKREEPRAVFEREEMHSALYSEALFGMTQEERQSWLAAVLAAKLTWPGAKVEWVRRVGAQADDSRDVATEAEG